ncbi:MAG: hypothetical protein ACKO96_00270, partial [Flammeovirgaceae bacterium]
ESLALKESSESYAAYESYTSHELYLEMMINWCLCRISYKKMKSQTVREHWYRLNSRGHSQLII